MKRKKGAFVSAVLSAVMVLAQNVPASGTGTAPEPGNRESAMAGTGSTVNREGAVSVSGGKAVFAESREDLEGFVSSGENGALEISGITLKDGDYGFTGISASDSDLTISESAITLDVDHADQDTSLAGTALYTDSGRTVVRDSGLTVNGAGRYAFAAEGTAELIMDNSVISSGGDEGALGNTSSVSEPASNKGLFISGTSRAGFSAGQSHTWYYHSLCLADGWGAFSTDSASGNGLELVSYDSDAVSLHGGYGLYADTDCRDYVYASNLISAEAGVIISNNGTVVIGSSVDAAEAETQDGNAVLSEYAGEPLEEEISSTVIAGRNAVMIHSPDMMGEGTSDYTGTLNVSSSSLVTEDSINEEGLEFVSEINNETYNVQASCDYAAKYGDAAGAYIDYIRGAAILIKSTSADITLTNTDVVSSSGIAVLSALNSDSMSRYLKADEGKGVSIAMQDSEIAGSIIHDDYQRDMNITAERTEISGAVSYADANQWNKYWSGFADDEDCVWYGLPAETYVTNLHETNLTLLDGSVWNPAGISRLTNLTVSEDSEVNGTIEAESEETTEDGLTVYRNAVVTGESVLEISTPSMLELSEEDILIDTSVRKETAVTEDSVEGTEKPGGEPLEGMPEGGMEGGPKPDGEPPEGMPGGGMEGGPKPDGEPPEGMPGGGMKGGPKPGGEPPEGMPGEQMSTGADGDSERILGSWTSGGQDAASDEGDDYAYDAALFVTEAGIDDEKSAEERVASGTYDGAEALDVTIIDSESGHNGILIYNTPYTISGALIEMLTEADGTDTCDFSGKGSAIAAFGSNAQVTVEDSVLHTAGVAAMPLFADDGAAVTLRGCELTSEGGVLHADYLNTPDQALMAAPPWILGIMGTSRASNMMGDKTTTNVIDSSASAGAWAVLSTDSGGDMSLNVYNSTLTLGNSNESEHPLQAEGGQIKETADNPYTVNNGSGYGTYVIGNAAETFAGTVMNVGTYAAVFTGGTGVYTSLEKGKTYELKNASGDVTAEYTAEEDKVTEIHSDTFGFMAHQGENNIILEKGTIVDSGWTSFLVKTGSSNEALTVTADQAEISNGGVLIQVMDNDDTTNGGMMDPDDVENTNGGRQNFIPYHTEQAGFRTEEAEQGSEEQTFTFTNGIYSGNIYNASGSDGLKGSALTVNLGEGAVLDGAAASTSAVHVTYDGSCVVKENGGFAFEDPAEAEAFAEQYQNTDFTIDEYFSIGQVANMIHDNGANTLRMVLTGDAVWNVSGTSVISSLEIRDEASVYVPEGVVLTADGKEYTGCIVTANGTEEL